jgi:ABC-type polar amino acid transport system ATPase subunit
MAKTRKGFGAKPRAKTKHKGAKDQSYKRKDKNNIKTKAKTANRNIDRRQQRVAIAKATIANENLDRNMSLDEAVPAATSDIEPVPE